MTHVSSHPKCVLRTSLGGRAGFVVTAVALAGLVVVGRLVHLQWFRQPEFARQSQRQRTCYETIPARPGEILDREGRVLATTVTTRSLYVVPSRIKDPRPVARELGQALRLDADSLYRRIAADRKKHFLWIKRRLTQEEADAVRQRNLPRTTWGFREEYLRRYPQGILAAHVMGLRDIDGRGRGGVEEAFDRLLRGRDGRWQLLRDAHGRVIEVRDNEAEAPRPGTTVVLTIDSVIEFYAERELDRLISDWKPHSACAIVLDPKTGELLAMASRPGFDPNHPESVLERAWKNTAIAAEYEPGSTFKPFVVAWALQNGVIETDDVFDCEHGAYPMGGRLLHDHHPYGRLDVSQILVKSSNIGMAKIGQRLGNEGLYDDAIAFGFGSPTGVALPGELSGRVRPLREWNGYSTGSVPMGQEIGVTPVQLITAYGALANGGKLIQPRLLLRHHGVAGVERSEPPDEHAGGPAALQPQPPIVSQTVDPEIARWIVQGPLADVVRSGTGRKARLEGYTVFGKTGTAQKFDRESGRYSSTRHISSFVCGGPADDPRIVVLVLADEPSVGRTHYGGEVSAPAAARILQKCLRHLDVPTETPPRQASRGDGG